MENELEIKLEGLNCANCANKIEEKIKKIEKVDEVFFNFINKEVKIKLKNIEDKNSTFDEIVKIVKKIEPTVNVIEKNNKTALSNKFALKLEGLNCAHCASKIEEKVKQIDKIKEAYLNFMNKELIIEPVSFKEKNKITKEVINIVKRIEPDVNVIEKTTKNIDVKKNINLFIILKFIFGIGLFISGIIFNNLKEYSNVSFILFICSYLVFGYDVIWGAIRNIFKGQVFDEKFLMFIATFGAFFIKEYTEAVAVMLFYQIGEFFQNLAVEKSRKSIKALMNIVPEKTNVIDGNNIKTIKPEEVEIGDIVIVKAGEKIPVDGVIVDGSSYIDMSALIGESMPKSVSCGDEVLSGSINQDGILKIKTLKKYEGSTVSKILNLVENAGSKKSKTENFITKFAKIYTPIVVLAAVAIAIIPPIFSGFEDFQSWFERALVFLVSSCPCALIVSVPLGFFSGIGYASKKGILIKGSNYLQALKDIETVVFDKTGTITKGVFYVDKIKFNTLTEKDFMKLAYSIEKLSNHPVAKAVVSKYEKDFGNDYFEISDFQEISGFGITGKIENKNIIAGNYKIMNKYNIEISEEFKSDTNVFISYDNKFIGEISVCDTIKEDSYDAIKKLKNKNIKTIMLTGDKKETADAVAKKLGIDLVYSDMLPQNKVKKLEEIINNKKGNVLFVGDGINDAPVLAMADVGVAMGGIGSDAAIEASDVVIMNDELSKIDDAIKISKNTMKIVKENIWLVLVVKFVVLILAAFGVSFANMWLAVFADVGVALLAVLNSMRKK